MIHLGCGLLVGQTFSPIHFLVVAFFAAVIENSRCLGFEQEPESFLQGSPQYEVVHPSRVDAKGHFLSNFLSHSVSRVQRRETPADPGGLGRVFYQLQHRGLDLHFNLTLNPHLLAPGFLTERRFGGLKGAEIRSQGPSLCHFTGEVWDRTSVRGGAAISTCNGLTGLFKMSHDEFFIRPLEQPGDESAGPQAHVIYKRHAPPAQSQMVRPVSGEQTINGTCGVKDGAGERVERQRERWERRQRRKRRIRRRRRSVSRERWVETLVVADSKMVDHHGSEEVEGYILAVMNIVSGLFRDPSIGNSINIVVVRLILLEKDEEDLKITHHADNSLSSFCKWQKRLNMKGEEHPVHHDVAVLLTRKDICAAMNKPCETLGLSHVAGMCQPHRSCSISEDTGLPLAFTIAHELGHNLGIQHDGNGNDCEPIGKRPFIMSPQLLYGTVSLSWSRCSRQYITRFLDRGWGWCLDDPPGRDPPGGEGRTPLSGPSMPPGVLYSAAHQCRLQYGSGSVLCDDVDNVCSTLWCTVGTTCHSRLDGAVDGTKCGEGKWCLDGECVAAGYRRESVSGAWAPWSEWSACSRTCGAGVQNAQRDCVNPVPKYGGKYCLGERRRYKICNSNPCPPGQPTFRHIQCSNFNTMPYRGKFYKWMQVNNRVNPCELHCRPLNEYFSEKMLDAVTDGTQCYEGSTSRDMCINGICKNVGCDYEIDSNAVEDRCGVCLGNGSTCETVKKTFEESEGLGYVDIGLIPEGAREIRIEEVAEAGNFLALRSDDPEKYFLNGGWTIQWNGEYKAAGTIFTYERTGHLENLTSPGPTMEPVWIQLLFQETNPGVRYEYTIRREVSEDSDNNIPITDFYWKYGSWTECSTTCGTGVQRQTVHCVEKTSGIVDEHYCDPATRPDDKRASCNEELCPAIWWVGEWQKCSSTCGGSGRARRTVLCIQAVGLEEQRALSPAQCQHMPRPESAAACNTHLPCPADWTTGNWTECSLTCGGGVQNRNVTCSRNTGVDCDLRKRPSDVTSCYLRDCPQIPSGGSDWSGSGSSSKEVFDEINSIPDADPPTKYGTTRAQPKARNDLNNLIEEDFPRKNHIEKTPDKSTKNSVKVDDFYYDYNFIKFHEDLSYDFDLGNNGKGQDGNLGLIPQPEPKHSPHIEENIYKETTIPPTSTSANNSNTTPNTLEDDKQEGLLDNAEDKTDNPTKKRVEINRDDEDDLFSDDYFMPVSSTASPVDSTTRFSQKWKERNGSNVDRPQNLSTAASLLLTTEGTLGDTEWGQPGEKTAEDSDIFGLFQPKESPNEDIDETVKIQMTAITPVGMESKDVSLPTEAMGEEREDERDSDYNSHEETTVGLQFSSSRVEMAIIATVGNESKDVGLPTVAMGEEREDERDSDYNSHEETTVGLQFSSSRVEMDSSAPTLHPPPPPGTTFDLATHKESFFTTALPQRDDTASETHPTATSPPYVPSNSTEEGYYHAFSPEEETDFDQQVLDTDRNTDKEFGLGVTDGVLTVTSHPVSRDTPPLATSTLSSPHSGNRESANDNTWPTVTASLLPPPTHLEGNSDIPPPSVAVAQTPSAATAEPEKDINSPSVPAEETPLSDWSNTSPPPPPSSLAWTEMDYNEIPKPPRMRGRGTSLPLGTDEPPSGLTAPTTTAIITTTTTTPQDGTTPMSPLPTPSPHTATPRSRSAPTGVDVTVAHWAAGNWSACSASCGLGAIWRSVVCSAGPDPPSPCDPAKRPAPARRCYLRPCSSWRTGEWSQCSRKCGGGVSLREVQCFDTRDQRPLRPFHCQAVSPRPPARMPCSPQPCLDWYTTSWGECSEVCGGGEQQRVVTCPEEDRCDEDFLPSSVQPCNSQPCAQWVTGSWGQCSALCGGGVQRRLVKCVNTKAETEEEQEHAQCDHEPWPENAQKCNTQECESSLSGVMSCQRNRLSFRFCQTLQWLGRCSLPTVQAQCCKTCAQRSRGNERTSRRR